MLQEKLKFLTENMKQQMLEQQENANEVDIEFKRLQMELDSQKSTHSLKEKELDQIEKMNNNIVQMKYDRKINELNFQMVEVEKNRTEFQNKMENLHNSFTCKLKLYVTDIQAQSDKTQSDFK